MMHNYYKNPITQGEKRLEHLLSLLDESRRQTTPYQINFGMNYEDLFYELGSYMGGAQFQEWAEDYINENDLERYMGVHKVY